LGAGRPLFRAMRSGTTRTFTSSSIAKFASYPCRILGCADVDSVN